MSDETQLPTFDELAYLDGSGRLDSTNISTRHQPKHAKRKKTVCRTDGAWLAAQVGLLLVGYVILTIFVLVTFNLE